MREEFLRLCGGHNKYDTKAARGMLKMQETLWKNNLNCVNDVPMIHVHFMVIVTVFPEEKIEGITFASSFVNVESRV
jgi:hypothetical protein